ncbi:MAG: hypothetical protein V2I25_02310 [Woeseiaceae bacterium]|nr:hypothetical protein [Woeseiaceae bacterium]
MARRAVQANSKSVAGRVTALVVLAGFSVPVLAASGLNLSCDDAASGVAESTSHSALPAEPAGDHEPLVVLKAEGSAAGIDPSRDLGSVLDYDDEQGIAGARQKAVADALERRRNGRLSAATGDADTMDQAPSIDTALPGVGDAESLIYRREMYRTDI